VEPGETIVGLDFQNHLWIVVSAVSREQRVALVNLTTHGRSSACGNHCVIIAPGEHPYVTRPSCVYYRGAYLNPNQPLDDAKASGNLNQHEPFQPDLLLRIQRGALNSRFTVDEVRDAISDTLRG
jgi:hypothetical protein